MFLFRLFLIKDNNLLGLLFRSGDTDHCTYVLSAFLQALLDLLAASWNFNQSESSFVLSNLLYALFFLRMFLLHSWLAKSREGHSTRGISFLYFNYVSPPIHTGLCLYLFTVLFYLPFCPPRYLVTWKQYDRFVKRLNLDSNPLIRIHLVCFYFFNNQIFLCNNDGPSITIISVKFVCCIYRVEEFTCLHWRRKMSPATKYNINVVVI